MKVASRIKIRAWLAHLSYEQIQEKLDQIKDPCVRQDVEYWLDVERELFRKGVYNEQTETTLPYNLLTAGELSLLEEAKR